MTAVARPFAPVLPPDRCPTCGGRLSWAPVTVGGLLGGVRTGQYAPLPHTRAECANTLHRRQVATARAAAASAVDCPECGDPFVPWTPERGGTPSTTCPKPACKRKRTARLTREKQRRQRAKQQSREPVREGERVCAYAGCARPYRVRTRGKGPVSEFCTDLCCRLERDRRKRGEADARKRERGRQARERDAAQRELALEGAA